MENLKKYLEVFRHSEKKTDLDLIQLLLEGENLSLEDAKRIIVFSPIIFARIHLSVKFTDLQFSTSYHDKSISTKRPLKEDSVYNVIYKFGLENFGENKIDEELYKNIIFRSSEMQGIVTAMKQGKTNLNGTNFRTLITI